MDSLQKYPALVLNADFRPLSYAPKLSTVPWQDAVKGVYERTHTVVAEYDRVVRSPSIEMKLPSVLMVHSYVQKKRRRVSFSRWNVFLAYSFHCQLCGGKFATTDLTFEHIVPQSKGGLSDWSNVVPACYPCNQRKGDKTLKQAGMHLHRPVYKPTPEQLDHLTRTVVMHDDYLKGCHKSWLDVLYWGLSLEPK